MNKNLDIGIIGFGNFGQFMAKHLCSKANIIIFDEIDKSSKASEIGVKFAGLDEVCSSNIVILAMPMEKLEETLNKISKKLRSGTLVIDVCSLKVFACEMMEKILPLDVDIVGTHPLFGPQSAKNGIEGMRIAICNVRGFRDVQVEKFCSSLGLKTFTISPIEHDKQMALSQALTHFIGQVGKKMNIERVDLSTKTFDDLMDVMEVIKNDTKALFENMQTMNPYAKEVREMFVEKSVELNDYLIELENDLNEKKENLVKIEKREN